MSFPGLQIDFDWVFVPAFPHEAVQILPSFPYLDAIKLNIVGGPSWRSNTLSRKSYKFGKLFFVGDDLVAEENEFTQRFQALFKHRPKIIEMRAYDGMKVLDSLMNLSEFKSRDELDVVIKNKENIQGVTGSWFLRDNIWLKNMSCFRLRRGRIEKVYPNTPGLNESAPKEEAGNQQPSANL